MSAALPPPMSDADREAVFRSLPDMLEGFMKTWGWLHFAKGIEAARDAQWQAYAQQARAELEAENAKLREALKNVTVHLIAAHSLLDRGGKKAAASDTIFKMMLDDYANSIEVGRAALKEPQCPSGS